MRSLEELQSVEVPENVKVSVEGRVVTVEGEKGTLTRNFSHAPVSIRLEDRTVKVQTSWPRKREAALVGVIRSHIQNMILGVTEGFTYRLFIHYKHFPITVQVQGDRVSISNFLGERHSRYAKIVDGITVEVKGDQLLVKGIDKEAVAQTAANIQRATKIRNLSLHGRAGSPGFLDGIYVFEKAVGEGKGMIPADKRRFARQHYFDMKICRECGARNALTATNCRRCKSKNLRKRKAIRGA